jgi:ribosome-associated translation inhibitor RaiA
MQVTPEIKFKDIDRSEWVELFVRERLGRLERYVDGITTCHVTLAQEQGSHHKGNIYSVMVEARIPPNRDLAAKKERSILHMQTELPALINETFHALEKQLKRAVETRSGWRGAMEATPPPEVEEGS